MNRPRRLLLATALFGASLALSAGPAAARTLVYHAPCTISTSESTENPLSDQGFRDPLTGTSYLPPTGPIGDVSCDGDIEGP